MSNSLDWQGLHVLTDHRHSNHMLADGGLLKKQIEFLGIDYIKIIFKLMKNNDYIEVVIKKMRNLRGKMHFSKKEKIIEMEIPGKVIPVEVWNIW